MQSTFEKILFFFLLMVISPFSAGAYNYQEVESNTLRMFNERKWDSLILVGKEALKQDCDYFYLRYRLGVAYFYTQRYYPAVEHLFRAHEMNSDDKFTMEYLYSAYLATHQEEEAHALSIHMPAFLRERLGIPRNALLSLSAEGGINFSSNDKAPSGRDLFGADSIYGERDEYRDNYYFNLSARFRLTDRICLTAGYNYLEFEKVKSFQFSRFNQHFDSVSNYWWGYRNWYSWHHETGYRSFPYRIHQNEVYLGVNIVLPEGYKITPMVHLIAVKYPVIQALYIPKVITDTIYFDSITPSTGIYQFTQDNYSFIQSDTSFINYLLSVKITKDFSIFKSFIGWSISNLNGMQQTQMSWSLTCYPLGVSGLYETTTLFGFFENQDNRLVFSQSVGGTLFRKLSLEGSLVYGNMTGMNLENGLVIFNNTDLINYRIGVGATYFINTHLFLSFIWQYFDKENTTWYRTYKEQNGVQTTQLASINDHYHSSFIIGGITWKL